MSDAAKKIKTAYRKYTKSNPNPLSLKEWAKDLDDSLKDDFSKWKDGKLLAVLCKQRKRINIKKEKNTKGSKKR